MSKAEKAIDLISEIESDSRQRTIKDIVGDLKDFLSQGPTGDDVDTWECGFKAAIEVITANYL